MHLICSSELDSADEVDQRIRAICCRHWSIEPWALDERIESGRLPWRYVRTLLLSLLHDPLSGMALNAFLRPRLRAIDDAIAAERARAFAEKEARIDAAVNQLARWEKFPPRDAADRERREKARPVLEAIIAG